MWHGGASVGFFFMVGVDFFFEKKREVSKIISDYMKVRVFFRHAVCKYIFADSGFPV